MCIDENICLCCCFEIFPNTLTGTTQISFPFKHLILQVKIRIIEKDVLLIPSIADMDRLGIYNDNIDDKTVNLQSGDTSIVTRIHDQLFLP